MSLTGAACVALFLFTQQSKMKMKLIAKLTAAALVVWALSWAYSGNEATDTKEWRLFKAVNSGDYSKAKKWLDEGADINAGSVRALGEKPLHWAIRKDKVNAVDWLINNGVDTNAKIARAGGDETLLQLAIYYNALEVANLLIDKGEDVNAKDESGKTLLHWAVVYDDSDFVELLVGKGVDVNAKETSGYTPLHLTADQNAADIARLLIRAGADIKAETIIGTTPLSEAMKYKAVDAANLLIIKGADVNAKDEWGRMPLHEAAKTNSAEAIDLLISKGADVNAKDNWGATPLHWAVINNAEDAAELLIANGADVNAREYAYSKSPLDIARRNGNKTMVEILRANQN